LPRRPLDVLDVSPDPRLRLRDRNAVRDLVGVDAELPSRLGKLLGRRRIRLSRSLDDLLRVRLDTRRRRADLRDGGSGSIDRSAATSELKSVNDPQSFAFFFVSSAFAAAVVVSAARAATVRIAWSGVDPSNALRPRRAQRACR